MATFRSPSLFPFGPIARGLHIGQNSLRVLRGNLSTLLILIFYGRTTCLTRVFSLLQRSSRSRIQLKPKRWLDCCNRNLTDSGLGTENIGWGAENIARGAENIGWGAENIYIYSSTLIAGLVEQKIRLEDL